jgi:multidrug resistance efflux pump
MELRSFRKWQLTAPLCAAFVLLSVLLYWLLLVRPYICIEKAHLATQTIDVRSESAGRLTSLRAHEGAWVEEGEILFSLSAAKEEAFRAELLSRIDSLNHKLSSHLLNAEEAMQSYLNACSDEAMGLEDGQPEFPLVKMQQQQEMAEQCKVQISTAHQELEHTKVEIQGKNTPATTPGFVVKRAKQEGEFLQAGDLIYSLCNPKKMWIEAVIPESSISKIKIGQKVFANLPSDSSCKWEGAIAWISPMALPDEQGVPVHISLGDALPDFLRPNLSVQLKIKVR